MARQWFYQDGGSERGPVSSLELKSLANAGSLSPESLIRQDGSNKWHLAGSVQGLFEQDTSVATNATTLAPTAPAPPPIANASNATEVPALVLGQNLLAGENVVATGRVHPLIFAVPALIAVVATIAVPTAFVFARNADLEEQRQAGMIVSLALLAFGIILVARALFHCLFVYFGHKVVLTNKRLIGHRGILSQEKTNLRVNQIEAIQVKQSLLGRMLNYGTISIGGTGASNISFIGIKDAVNFQQLANEYVDRARN